MSASQSQGHRSGEGTAGLWNHVRDDDQCKEKEPDRGASEDSRPQYGREGDQHEHQHQHPG
jgi:hypothetical protein